MRPSMSALMVVVAAAMLAIPWVVPLWPRPERVAAVAVAGVIELALGITLAYLVLNDDR
jgi:hypothetical protein